MTPKYFSLGPAENSNHVKIIRIIFGLVCIGIAAFWTIFNIRSLVTERTLWITIIFITAFGSYQVWAGLGRAARFIEIDEKQLILRKNSFLKKRIIQASEIKKIEIYPLNLIIYLHSKSKIILRFGTAYTDNIDPIKSEIEFFATGNSILTEIKSEVI
jgi:hypothetical protein